MLFNEKLYKLRKENGLSQEALAEKLNTSRQAVSKWENNQGYPETEKILLMSNLFGVSVDYLLKDSKEDSEVAEKGYYASKEMVEGYFSNRKSSFGTMALGVFVLVLGIGAYCKFAYEDWSPAIMVSLLLVGGIILMKGCSKLEDKFNVLEKEVLIFDQNFLKELQKDYQPKVTKLTSVLGVAVVVFLLCALPIAREIEPFVKDFSNGIPPAFEVMFLGLTVATPIVIYTGSLSEMYLSILNHEKHINSVGFRLRRKLKNKGDEWLK